MNKKLKYDPFGNTIKEVKRKTNLRDSYIRQTYIIKKEYIDKLKCEAYWNRITQKEILDKILKDYFKDKNIKEIPDK